MFDINEEIIDFNEINTNNNKLKLNNHSDLNNEKTNKIHEDDEFYFFDEEENNEPISLEKNNPIKKSEQNINDKNAQIDIYDEIINDLSKKKYNSNDNIQFKKESKKKNLFKKTKTLNQITIFIKKNKEEIEKLANTEEISNFDEYNETCISLLDELVHLNSNIPPKIKFPFAKDIPEKKRLAIFDLDETLAHSEFKNIDKAQHKITVKLPSNIEVKIGLNIRPHWKKALKEISKHYFIVIYTASDHSYADAILNYIDPDKEFFEYRLYRSNCIFTKVKSDDKLKFYVKDLNIFEDIDLKDMVIIDNSILSYAYHLNNGIPILPYYNSEKDFELMFLAGYLNQIYKYDDLREANKKYIKLENMVEMIKNKDEKDENTEELPMKNNCDTSIISGFLEKDSTE
jgi:Dullard-like phosphatase family protein